MVGRQRCEQQGEEGDRARHDQRVGEGAIELLDVVGEVRGLLEDPSLLLALRQDHDEIVEREFERQHAARVGLQRLLRLDAADHNCHDRQQDGDDHREIGDVQQQAGGG